MGRITDVTEDEEHIVRSVKLKITQDGCLKSLERPIAKVVVLLKVGEDM